jgi:hypothetical protein
MGGLLGYFGFRLPDFSGKNVLLKNAVTAISLRQNNKKFNGLSSIYAKHIYSANAAKSIRLNRIIRLVELLKVP